MAALLSIFITACGGGGGDGSGNSSAIPLNSLASGLSGGGTSSAVSANPITVGLPGAVVAGASGPVAIDSSPKNTPANVESTNLAVAVVSIFPAATAVSVAATSPVTNPVVASTVQSGAAFVRSTIVTKLVAAELATTVAINPPVVDGNASTVVAVSTPSAKVVTTPPAGADITPPWCGGH